jgi:hypothetical protein
MKSTHLVVAALAVLFASAMTQDAQAQHLYGLRNGYGPGGGCGSSLYSLGRIPVPPYFALHPPVYYSGITPTTYGSSPFARRPARAIDYPVHEMPKSSAKPTSSPALTVGSPQVVMNPFVGASEDLGNEPPSRVRTVKVILNPFVREKADEIARAQ